MDPLDDLWFNWQLKAGRDESDNQLDTVWTEFREEALEISVEQQKRAFAGGFYHGLLVGLKLAGMGGVKTEG